jgi:hypothetical protein
VLYCELCGAANDILSRQCHRCGGALALAEAVFSTATRTAAVNSPAEAAGSIQLESVGAPNIGESLDLPDWLKRAAAQTPPASSDSQEWPTVPPTGFRVSLDESNASEPDLTAQPLPPVPTTDLPAAMPDWLKNPPAAPAVQAVSKTPVVEPPVTAQPSSVSPAQPDADAANTATFIAESDLPEWIRQIAAADAAKQAEADRLAAEAALQADAETRKRIFLPGEAAASMPVSNPWLNRREGAGASQAWSAPASKTAPVPEIALAVEYEETSMEQAVGVPEEVAQSAGRARPKLQLPAMGGRTFAESSSRIRLYLLGAGVLLLMLILLMVI